MKDISVYNMLGLSPSQIYIVGRPSKKYQNQCLVMQHASPLTSFPLCVLISSDFLSSLSSALSVPERRLRRSPLHPSVRPQSQTQEIPFCSHGPEERLVWPLGEARLPVQAHPPAQDHVSAAARPAVHAKPKARASSEPARVRQGPRGRSGRRRRRWTGHMGTVLHASWRHDSLTSTQIRRIAKDLARTTKGP